VLLQARKHNYDATQNYVVFIRDTTYLNMASRTSAAGFDMLCFKQNWAVSHIRVVRISVELWQDDVGKGERH